MNGKPRQQQAGEPASAEAMKVSNGLFAGVAGTYLISRSVPATAIAAVLAGVVVLSYLFLRR